MNVQMLTKDACPKCMQLKMFLQMGLGDKYKEDIEVIHQSEKPEVFAELVDKFSLQTAPALIVGEDVLTDCSPMKAEEFLRTKLGK